MSHLDRIDVELTGGCQCGAVRYRATQRLDNAHICHCRMCQKAVGNLFAALVGLPLDAFRWTRGAPSTFKSSDRAERGFCAQCGTPLFYQTVGSSRLGITIGSLDDPDLVVPQHQFGLEAKVAYFEDLHHLEGSTTEQDDPGGAAAIRSSNRQHPDHDTQAWPPEHRG